MEPSEPMGRETKCSNACGVGDHKESHIPAPPEKGQAPGGRCDSDCGREKCHCGIMQYNLEKSWERLMWRRKVQEGAEGGRAAPPLTVSYQNHFCYLRQPSSLT